MKTLVLEIALIVATVVCGIFALEPMALFFGFIFFAILFIEYVL